MAEETPTIEEQMQENLYQASVIWKEQIVPLLTEFAPGTPAYVSPDSDVSTRAIDQAFRLKQRMEAQWNAFMLPILRELDAVNNPPPQPPVASPIPEGSSE